MSRMLIFVLALVLVSMTGCCKSKHGCAADKCDQACPAVDPNAVTADTETPGIIRREWQATEIKCTYGQPLKANKYFDNYSYLDRHYSVEGSATWSKKNAKRALTDPFYTLADIVVAPLSYGYDRYKNKSEESRPDIPVNTCQQACDPNSCRN